MAIALLGGGGFLGLPLARRLLTRGERVLILHRGRRPIPDPPSGVRVILADRQDGPALEAIFAAEGVSAVADLMALTLETTRPAIEAAARRKARYLLVSSIDVYANYGGLLKLESPEIRLAPATEDSPLRRTRHPYKGDPRRPKGPDDDLLEHYDKIPIEEALLRADLESVVVRPPMIFGPGDKQNRFGWIQDAMRPGEPFLIDERAWGWPSSYAYVEDVAEAMALALLSPRAAGRTYNLGQSFQRSQADWARRIGGILRVETEIRPAPAGQGALADRAEILDLRYPLTQDSSRIRTELGFRETLGEEEALERTLAAHRAD